MAKNAVRLLLYGEGMESLKVWVLGSTPEQVISGMKQRFGGNCWTMRPTKAAMANAGKNTNKTVKKPETVAA